MQKVTMMILHSCPYCRQALSLLDELKQTHPEYAEIPVDVYDETEYKQLADSLDYYYVPACFVGGKKLLEGVPSRKKVEDVLRAALL